MSDRAPSPPLRLLWPITIKLESAFGRWKTIGTHSWPAGWDPIRRRDLRGWTLHLGPLKVMFGDNAPVRRRLWLFLVRVILGSCRHQGFIADILEGDAMPMPRKSRAGERSIGHHVRWCPDCGAVQVVTDQGYYELRARELRTPRRQGGAG